MLKYITVEKKVKKEEDDKFNLIINRELNRDFNLQDIRRKLSYLVKIKKILYERADLYQQFSRSYVDIFYGTLFWKDSMILIREFIRPIPDKQVYYDRLVNEFRLVAQKKFTKVFLQVREILDLANLGWEDGRSCPHIIRGSSGSSLICYLMGITNIDPIKEKISLARFMHEKREDIPDIDIDFPHKYRDEIYLKIYNRWKGRVARISNHVMFKKKSALKEVVRKHGYHKFLPKDFNLYEIFDDPDEVEDIMEEAEKLEGQFKNYSLHCGGIVIFENEVPEDLFLQKYKILRENKLNAEMGSQIKLNKDEVEEQALIKIDVLSNRGLSQLWDISHLEIEEYPNYDRAVCELFASGQNLGLTYAESRGMYKIFRLMKPKCIDDIALALALIRPAAAGNGQKSDFLKTYSSILTTDKKREFIIYDDDAIQFIQKILCCNEADADQYRKAFAKNKHYKKLEFERQLIKKYPNLKEEDVEFIITQLEQLQAYSFCKSHAISYAKLVWALAYQKVNNPKEFWLATLNNCNSSFRKWVHFREAKNAGITLNVGKPPWSLKDISGKTELVCKGMQKRFLVNDVKDYFTYGYWISNNFLSGMYCEYYDGNPNESKKRVRRRKGETKEEFELAMKKLDEEVIDNVKMVRFKGLIATGRAVSAEKNMKRIKVKQENGGEKVKDEDESAGINHLITFITIGYEDGKYLDLVLWGKYPLQKLHCIEGEGIVKNEDSCPYVEVLKFKFCKI